MQDIEVNEVEWYLRDYFFRQFNQGRQQFKKELLASEMINLYLRYRNSKLQYINDLINIVLESLVSRQIIKEAENNSLELENRFSRLQCSKCFYISYLTSKEPRNCLRCLSIDLYDFPKKK